MHKSSVKPYLFTLVILISLISLAAQPHHPVQAAPMLFTVTKTADSGTGTLRWAIEQANTNSGHDEIEFNIPMTDSGYDPQKGIWTIYLQTPLILTNPGGVEIDGTSQTFYKGDTNPLGPEIAISGSCYIDFGFDISNRFWIAQNASSVPHILTSCSLHNDTTLWCQRYDLMGYDPDGDIMLIVY